ncbi:MAG: nucleotidyltransferase domain-containing protein [Patescibacteria group bacterium]
MDLQIPEQTQKQLEKLGVSALYLFGSRAMGAEGPLSDFDFAVLMNHAGHSRGDKTYDALYDLLSPLCSRTLENDVIDIVFLRDAPLELKAHIIRYGKILFESNPLERGQFEEETTLEAADFRPHQNIIDQTILASL